MRRVYEISVVLRKQEEKWSAPQVFDLQGCRFEKTREHFLEPRVLPKIQQKDL